MGSKLQERKAPPQRQLSALSVKIKQMSTEGENEKADICCPFFFAKLLRNNIQGNKFLINKPNCFSMKVQKPNSDQEICLYYFSKDRDRIGLVDLINKIAFGGSINEKLYS